LAFTCPNNSANKLCVEAPWAVPTTVDAQPSCLRPEGIELLRGDSIPFRILTSLCGLFHSLALKALFAFSKFLTNWVSPFGKEVLEPIKITKMLLQTPKTKWLLFKQFNELDSLVYLRRRTSRQVTDIDVTGKTEKEFPKLTGGEPFQPVKKCYPKSHHCSP
jgi:hypothetical protein